MHYIFFKLQTLPFSHLLLQYARLILKFLLTAILTVFVLFLTSTITEENEGTVAEIHVSSRLSKIFDTVGHSEKYCVVYNYWQADGKYTENHITLVLHSTVEYLNFLEDQLKTWQGGISIALLIPNPSIQPDLNNTVNFWKSSQHFKTVISLLETSSILEIKKSNQVSLHLFFEKQNYSNCPMINIPIYLNYQSYGIKDLQKFGKVTELYPINTARNIARKGIKTELFISGDIEQFYVANFEPRMYKLAEKVLLEGKKQTVLIHRRFEIREDVQVPKNKQELLILLQNHRAFKFHQLYNGIAHVIPNLRSWLKTEENTKESQITEVLSYQNSKWEPQFVGDSRVPFHDEQFPYRYRTNQQLGQHLCFMNFTFSVVSDVFSIHRGVVKGSMPKYRQFAKMVSKLKPYPIRSRFLSELSKKYPGMKKKCFA